MHEDQRVSDMAVEVLARQARSRAERTGGPFEGEMKAVLQTDAGRQLGELRDGPHRDEEAGRWQEHLPQQRAKERSRARQEERSRAQLEAAWERFMRAERRGLELRKNGQLAKLLGEPLPGEPPEALRRLAAEDRRQAEEGLVALMRNGVVSYKHLEKLSEGDMPYREAANRLRLSWLKGRSDLWLPGGSPLRP